MPSKNVVKLYVNEGFYHLYNRGVEKRTIFEDRQDYKVFLKNLKESLTPPQDIKPKTVQIGTNTFIALPKPPRNFYGEIELLTYCLMPNHFHLLVRQKKSRSIEGFMRTIATKYAMYFNKRYDRIGSLFQGPYKAALVENENYLLHLSRYIHLNPVKVSPLRDNFISHYSSYVYYLGIRKSSWLKTEVILNFFKSAQKSGIMDTLSYQGFVEDYKLDSKVLIGETAID